MVRAEVAPRGVFGGGTVVYAALQAASCLGFSPVYILGMDMTFGGARPRFYEAREHMRPSWLARDFERTILPCLRLMARFGQTSGFGVYNLSPISQVPADIIPRRSLGDAL